MGFYDTLLRPILFNIDPERAHDLAKRSLKVAFPWTALVQETRDPRLKVELGSLALRNPICLSPGFDKNAESLAGLAHLGFGAVTVGSILPYERAGNPKPRLLRYPSEESLGNCYGLPSDGLDVIDARLRRGVPKNVPVIANIDAPSVELYIRSFERLEPLVSAIELGLQCPNNRDDHGEFHDSKVFEQLLTEIMKRRTKPLFLKFAMVESDSDLSNRLDLVDRAIRFGVDGVNVPGIKKRPEPKVSLGVATITGRAILERTLNFTKEVSRLARGRIAVRANGGVMNGEDALKVLMAGATTIDVLSAFVYRGWRTADLINRELLELMNREGIASLKSIARASSPARAA